MLLGLTLEPTTHTSSSFFPPFTPNPSLRWIPGYSHRRDADRNKEDSPNEVDEGPRGKLGRWEAKQAIFQCGGEGRYLVLCRHAILGPLYRRERHNQRGEGGVGGSAASSGIDMTWIDRNRPGKVDGLVSPSFVAEIRDIRRGGRVHSSSSGSTDHSHAAPRRLVYFAPCRLH
jgi:hypothetical protein